MRAYNRPGLPRTVAEFQPRARHFMHIHGMTDPEMFLDSHFVTWIQAQWRDYATEYDINPDALTNGTHGDDFDAWLQRRCGCTKTPAPEVLPSPRR